MAPNNSKLHHNTAFYTEGAVNASPHPPQPHPHQEREFHYREAIRLYPLYVSAYINLGVLLSQSGRTNEAIEVRGTDLTCTALLTQAQQYRLAIEAHWKKPLYSTNVALIYRNIGASYLQLQDGPGALQAYKDCLKFASRASVHAPRLQECRYEPGHPGCKEMIRRIRESFGL